MHDLIFFYGNEMKIELARGNSKGSNSNNTDAVGQHTDAELDNEEPNRKLINVVSKIECC